MSVVVVCVCVEEELEERREERLLYFCMQDTISTHTYNQSSWAPCGLLPLFESFSSNMRSCPSRRDVEEEDRAFFVTARSRACASLPLTSASVILPIRENCHGLRVSPFVFCCAVVVSRYHIIIFGGFLADSLPAHQCNTANSILKRNLQGRPKTSKAYCFLPMLHGKTRRAFPSVLTAIRRVLHGLPWPGQLFLE
jgi:hypothetical protein